MNNRKNGHIEGEHELFDGAVADLLALEGGVRKQGQILEGGDGERLELFPRKGGLHRLLLPLDLAGVPPWYTGSENLVPQGLQQNRGDFWIQGFLQNKGDWLIRKRMKKSYLVKDVVSERKTPR